MTTSPKEKRVKTRIRKTTRCLKEKIALSTSSSVLHVTQVQPIRVTTGLTLIPKEGSWRTLMTQIGQLLNWILGCNLKILMLETTIFKSCETIASEENLVVQMMDGPLEGASASLTARALIC